MARVETKSAARKQKITGSKSKVVSKKALPLNKKAPAATRKSSASSKKSTVVSKTKSASPKGEGRKKTVLAKGKAGAPSAKSKPVSLLVGTRKGAFVLRSDATRKNWSVSKPLFLGHIVYHIVSDPRGSGVVVMGAKTGHLGPTVLRSLDKGKTWKESTKPPAFTKLPAEEKGRAVENVFWISPGHATEPGVWYAGTSPPGLFRSEDNGDTWEPVSGFNEHSMYGEWFKNGPTPGGQMVHSVRIDPRDPAHIYVGVSVGGVFESTDAGAEWRPLNKGCAADFSPDPDVQFGHDPHCLILHDLEPDRLYQQNHCGIYSMDRSQGNWIRIGNNMPKSIGDIGFPIVAHPRDADCIWVFPMDGTDVWPRTSPGGKPAVYISRNGGKSWQKQNKGLPDADAYFTVKRQAMTNDQRDKVGLYFGTTCGEVWGSINEGENWKCLVRYLPEIYSLTILED